MEIYILDSLYRRNRVVDKFESFIWTERWNEIGDFELDLKSTLENRSNFMVETRLAINNSNRVMVVETVEDKVNDEGEAILYVKGRSLEALLEHRVAKESMESTDPWYLTVSPIGLPRTIYMHTCAPQVLGLPEILNPDDVLSFIEQRFPQPEVPPDEEMLDWAQENPDTVLNEIRKACVTYDFGFRIVREGDELPLYFEVYPPRDRTTQQSIGLPVIFGVGLDNVQNTTEFSSVQNSKNVAYVFAPQGHAIVYGEDVDPDVENFDRRVLLVTTNVPDAYLSSVSDFLNQEGKAALQNHRGVSLFDGEVSQRNEYVYGIDYELGDLVEMRNRDGVVSYKRVTEQIFVEDQAGERSYPTLSIGRFIGLDSWLAYSNKDTAWEDFTDEVWADM